MRTLLLILAVFLAAPALGAEPPAGLPLVGCGPGLTLAKLADNSGVICVKSEAPAPAPIPASLDTPPACPAGQEPVKSPSGNYVCTPLPVDPGTDIVGFLKAVVNLAKSGNWAGAILLGICLLVWALRRFGGMIPGPVGEWFKGDVGGIVMAFLGSLTAVLGGAAYTGITITGTMALGAFLLAFAAMGAWRSVKILLRKLPESVQKKLDWLFDLLPAEAPAEPAAAPAATTEPPKV